MVTRPLGNKITSVFNEEDHILGGRGSRRSFPSRRVQA
jgi:hypothetical protein